MSARAVWAAVKPKAERELGLFVFMVLFGLAVVAIAVPAGWVLAVLPDWAFWVLLVVGMAGLLFGDSIATGVRTYRGVKP